MKAQCITMILLALTASGFAQTLAHQGFEASVDDTWSYTAVPAGMNRLVWWGRSDQPMGGANAHGGSWYWASWDLDNQQHSLTFDPVSLTPGYIHSLSFWYYSNGLDPETDELKYSVQYDTGTEWTDWVTLASDTDAWTQVILDIPAYATTVRLKLAAAYDGFAKYAHWDDIDLTNSPAPPTAPLVYNTCAAQRTDGSKTVDVYYDLFDANQDTCTVSLALSTDGGLSYPYTPDPANLSGDLGDNIANGTGKHIIWNAGAEGVDYVGEEFSLKIVAEDNSEPPIPENFILVEGGTFNNGTSDVTVSSFYLDKYELTQAGYLAVMGIDPASGYGDGDNYPVYYVSWFSAIEYCNRRSLQEGLPPCYSYSTYGTNPDNWPYGWNTSSTNHTNVSCNWTANGYRLPSEMEWMFAAKGGNQSQGYTYSGCNNLNEVGWYNGNSGGTTHTVGTKAANELGTFDMSGNVWEWVWDIYGSYPSGPQTDPHGATSGSARVGRGGSWIHNADYCTVSSRYNFNATYSNDSMGFRVCRSLDNFILVEGGTFNNGTSDVTISSFYIDKHELTQAGYQAVMGTNPAYGYGVSDKHPVYYVSWFNAIEYCNRRSQQEALTPCYSYSTYGTNPDNWPSGWNTSNSNHTNVNCNWSANGYRLPTEMEWMFAAMGGNQSQGYTYSGSNDINAVAWYSSNSGGTTHSVGTKAPNELGTFDMSGNVWEWCWEVYSEYYHVGRGGSWSDPASNCSLSSHTGFLVSSNGNYLGFRVCRVSP